MITITVQDDQVRAELQRIQRKLGDLTPAMAGIAMALETAVSNRFETKTDPLGQPWATWKPSTVKRYPPDGNGTLLDRYGDMLDSLNSTHTKDTAAIGFGAPYAAYHEWGTQRMERRGLLTADPAVPSLAPADVTAVLDVLRSFLDTA
jgi:phage virion morphogenesis protein